MKLTQILIYGGIAVVGIFYIIPQLKSRGLLNFNFGINGGIGGAGQAGGIGLNGAPGASANGGSNATVCTGSNCQTFSGDNISVSCVNGKCHSNNARVVHWSY